MFLVRDEEAYSDEQSSSQRHIFTASHDSRSSVSVNMWNRCQRYFLSTITTLMIQSLALRIGRERRVLLLLKRPIHIKLYILNRLDLLD